MKRVFFVPCVLLGLVCSSLAVEGIPAAPVAGAGLPIPVCWMRKAGAEALAAGVLEDDEKFVFALLLPNASEKCSLGIYWNADGDVSTGRFPGTQGVDLQLNVSFGQRKIDAVIWEDAVAHRYMTLYEDDYVLERCGNCLFVAIRKLAVHQARHAVQSKGVIKWSEAGGGSAPFAIGPQAPRLGYMPANCPFLRLQARDRGRGKPIVAEDVGGLPSGLRVWNCGGERFAEGEPSPEPTATVSALTIQAARGEQEHLFFAAETKAEFCGMKAQPGILRSQQGDVLPAECQQLRFADYVANDRGEWFTDVLLPESPRRPVHRQFLVWSVTVPRQAAKGRYSGTLSLEIGEQRIAVPVQVEV
ncbi:MAG: hypothetical protein IJJ33_10700, partial [Victivallales bacterium]|nr:hypothetical protein [Victivallales bacterium]